MFLPRIHTHQKSKGNCSQWQSKKKFTSRGIEQPKALDEPVREMLQMLQLNEKRKRKKRKKKAFDIVRLHRGERRWQLRTPQKGTTQPTVWWGEKHRTAHQRRYTFRFSYCCLNGLPNVLYIRYINSELNLGYCQRFFMAELFFPLLCCVSLPPCSPPSSS